MRLYKKYKGLQLREKITITFLIFGFLPILLASILIQNSVIESFRQETEKSGIRSIDQIAQSVNEHMHMYQVIADTAAQDRSLIQLLNHEYQDLGDAIDLYHYIWRMRDSILRDNAEIESVTLFVSQPELVSEQPYVVCLDSFEQFSDYDSILMSRYTPYFASGYMLFRDGDPKGSYRVTVNRVIMQPNSMSQPIGVISLNIDLNDLQKLIKNSIVHSATMLVDPEGLITAAVWNDVEAPLNSIGSPVVHYIPKDIWDKNQDVRYKDEKFGETYLIMRELNFGWKVVSVLSVDALQSDARIMQRKSLIIICSCAMLAIILVAIANARTTRRVSLLLNKFSVGERATLSPGTPVGGTDEISELDNRFMNMANQLNQAVHDLYEVELQKKEHMLAALQARINPHFLYNTLSDIGWMTQTSQPDEVRKAIEMLVTYYRGCLSGGLDIIPLRKELDNLDAYINIQKLHMGHRLQMVILTDPMLDEIRIPKMALQPIVENSLQHGISNQHPGISISITSSVKDDQALIIITDDGPGFEQETLAQLSQGSFKPAKNGYGIQNVQMRLKLSFGEEYGLNFENLSDHGARTIVRLPLREKTTDEK